MKQALLTAICALLLICTGCGAGSTADRADTADAGLTVVTEDVEISYCDCIKAYFEAISQKDFESYCAVIYPPYLASYEAYLQANGSEPEEAFTALCSQFDEDGYEHWMLTEADLSYYPEENVDLEGFFQRYVSAGIFDEQLAAQCKEESEEIRDIQFTLYALYEGDAEAVPVVNGKELIAVKTVEGVYLFG